VCVVVYEWEEEVVGEERRNASPSWTGAMRELMTRRGRRRYNRYKLPRVGNGYLTAHVCMYLAVLVTFSLSFAQQQQPSLV